MWQKWPKFRLFGKFSQGVDNLWAENRTNAKIARFWKNLTLWGFADLRGNPWLRRKTGHAKSFCTRKTRNRARVIARRTTTATTRKVAPAPTTMSGWRIWQKSGGLLMNKNVYLNEWLDDIERVIKEFEK